MDNLTHSIIGLAVGELVHRTIKKPSTDAENSLRRHLLWITAWAASNFPDLDLFLGGLLPQPLGYLLHHRGHTHTLIYLIPQAALLLLSIVVLWPAGRNLLKTSGAARVGFLLSALIGLGLHLLMDYFNSYGVHPFYPINKNWIYGDMIFIVEPLFWIALGLPVALEIKRYWLKAFCCSFLLVVPLSFALTGYLNYGSVIFLWLLAGVLSVVVRRRKSAALVVGILASLLFISGQGIASKIAKNQIKEILSNQDKGFEILDVAANSYPSNPFCWMFTSVAADSENGIYRMHRGLVSLAPSILPVSQCARSLSSVAQQNKVTAQVAFLFSQDTSIEYLRLLEKDNCQVSAWLRFVRAPLIGENQASDLRFYGFTEEQNFTTLLVNAAVKPTCQSHIPKWGFPRADLLGK